jgi:hypothetical protein
MDSFEGNQLRKLGSMAEAEPLIFFCRLGREKAEASLWLQSEFALN